MEIDFPHGLSDFAVNGAIGKTMVLGGRWESAHKNQRQLDDLSSVLIREKGIGMAWKELNVSLLCRDFPKLKFIDVEYQQIDDLDWISHLECVEHIGVRCGSIKEEEYVLQARAGVRSVSVSGHESLLELIGKDTWLIKIERLRSTDLNFLARTRVQRVEIVRAPSLIQIDCLTKLLELCEVKIYAAPRLTDISPALVAPSIVSLTLQICKAIHAPTKPEKSNLQSLSLLDCGKITSVTWIDGLKNLESLRISGTTAIDGQVAFLNAMDNLKSVVVENKRHYDMKFSLPTASRLVLEGLTETKEETPRQASKDASTNSDGQIRS